MTKFIYFKKGSCPVCGGARKDCLQSLQNGLVFCRDIDSNPPNYKFVRETARGFGLWAEKAAVEAHSQEQWEERQRQRQLEKQQRLEAQKKQRSQRLQEVITEQRLPDCLEHLENLNFLGKETQLFCLNFTQYLQRGCRG